jgi:hypothetical protein
VAAHLARVSAPAQADSAASPAGFQAWMLVAAVEQAVSVAPDSVERELALPGLV